jgi:hypothetical protein
MKLIVKRVAKKPKYTIGKLYIDGEYFCDTLEDTDRDLDQSMTEEEIASRKVYGKTAIPTGTYKITMNVVSPRFKNRSWAKPWNGKIPRLLDVPGYDGVLIHVGNTEQDCTGCLLVGTNNVVGKVTNSTTTFHKLMEILTKADNITITIM